jgi:hypothetical protein
MKRYVAVAVSIVFVGALAAMASAQSAPNSHTKPKSISLAGKVMNGGAELLCSGKRTWASMNTELLRAHVGESVMIRGLLDRATGKVQVSSWEPMPSEASASARLGDSAFRR